MREKNLDEVSFLRKLASDDAAIAAYTVAGNYNMGYCLIPSDLDLRNIDVGGCLEETLHRIIDQDEKDPAFCGYSKEEAIAAVMLADKEPADENEEVIEIDLGYRTHGPLLTVNPFIAFFD